MNLAPIIVFVYNRASHLEKTLKCLRANKLSNESILFVYCDGAKPDSTQEQLNKISAARKVVSELAITPSFKEVHIIERKENLGLGKSIITGVTEVINQYGRAIVLEDDLETSPLFLDYMNKCLDHYDARKSVFSISGLSRPHPEKFYPKDYPYDVYVSLAHHPQGWASWSDRWNQVDWEVTDYQLLKNNKDILEAFRRSEYGIWEELTDIMVNHKNNWGARFALAHFVNHAVSICPIVSYINHFGMDAEATNATGSSSLWKFETLADNEEIKFCDVLYEDKRIINAWYSFSIPKKRSPWGKLKNWFGRKFLNRDEFALKGKVYV